MNPSYSSSRAAEIESKQGEPEPIREPFSKGEVKRGQE